MALFWGWKVEALKVHSAQWLARQAWDQAADFGQRMRARLGNGWLRALGWRAHLTFELAGGSAAPAARTLSATVLPEHFRVREMVLSRGPKPALIARVLYWYSISERTLQHTVRRARVGT
jgi:hypothetical protein